jgi:hypothetical protein
VLRDKGETRKRLGDISLSCLDRLIAMGLLVPAKVGGRVFFRDEVIENFIRNAERKARDRARERVKKRVLTNKF